MFQSLRRFTGALVFSLSAVATAPMVLAADRADVENFLTITGFDVALDSIALGAEDAPSMLGLENNAFGESWRILSAEIFDVDGMRVQAVDILEATLEQDLLDHAVAFYGSDLGKRLVHSENLSHMDDDDLKQIAGLQLVELLEAQGSPKLAYFTRMNDAIDPNNIGLRAVQTIQVRFLLAASRAGVIDADLDEDMLWAQIEANNAEVLEMMAIASVAAAAYTYQDFSDAEIEAYTVALEDPNMQLVYELMNAVHYQIMGERFDALAAKLDQLTPSQDL